MSAILSIHYHPACKLQKTNRYGAINLAYVGISAGNYDVYKHCWNGE